MDVMMFCDLQTFVALNGFTSLEHNYFSSTNTTTIIMWIPRAFSEPVPVRIDPIWKQTSPIVIPRAHIPSYRPRSRGVRSQACSARPMPSVHAGSTHLAGSQTSPTLEEGIGSKRKNRGWFMNIVMAPCDFVEWTLKKWGNPSKDCMNCVKVTYWIVLIVGGIVSTVMAIAPFL